MHGQTCSLPPVQVGCFLKTPRFPIWVVCSESHFSVLFSLQPELLRDWRTERLFDLYYYDGLANQQEQIRLTVGALPPSRPLQPRGTSRPVGETGLSAAVHGSQKAAWTCRVSGLGAGRRVPGSSCSREPEPGREAEGAVV